MISVKSCWHCKAETRTKSIWNWMLPIIRRVFWWTVDDGEPHSFQFGEADQFEKMLSATATSTLRMSDNNALTTEGMITLEVKPQNEASWNALLLYCCDTQIITRWTQGIATAWFVNHQWQKHLRNKPEWQGHSRICVCKLQGSVWRLWELYGKLHMSIDPMVCPVWMPLRKLPVPIKARLEQERWCVVMEL